MCPTQPSMYINTALGPGMVDQLQEVLRKKTREVSELREGGNCMPGRASGYLASKVSQVVTLA